MHRSAVLGAILASGTISITVSAYRAPQQGPTASGLNATRFEKVKDNLFVITGSGVANQDAFSGGNTAVWITEKGVVLVDTKLPGWGQALLDRIKTVTDKPVTTIINTHTHGDHTGSNEFFGSAVQIVAHENTKTNMAKMDAFKADKAKFLPAGYADFNRDFVAWAASQMKAGKTVGQAVAEYRVPERYKGYTVAPGPGMEVAKANVETVFNELKR
jgi:glyoxylase-like metal-dependent hydrolase (beta-lactamase superfamily II)